MSKEKQFDCVRMKDEIQQKILAERKALGAEEQRKRAHERIAANPVLGPIWQRTKERA